MQELIGTYGKSAAIGAGGGFLLSFIVGLASGNPFVVVLARAFVFLILFGALGAGGKALIGRFLPELSSLEGPHEDAPRRTVDIVLPEENPHAEQPGVRVADADVTRAEQDAEAEEVADLDGAISEEGPPDGGIATEEPRAGGGATAPQPRAAAEGKEEAGGLPDLDSLGGSFSPSGGGRTAGTGRSMAAAAGTGRSTAAAAGAEGLAGEDPADLARMIRTVLKKDEKG